MKTYGSANHHIFKDDIWRLDAHDVLHPGTLAKQGNDMIIRKTNADKQGNDLIIRKSGADKQGNEMIIRKMDENDANTPAHDSSDLASALTGENAVQNAIDTFIIMHSEFEAESPVLQADEQSAQAVSTDTIPVDVTLDAQSAGIQDLVDHSVL